VDSELSGAPELSRERRRVRDTWAGC